MRHRNINTSQRRPTEKKTCGCENPENKKDTLTLDIAGGLLVPAAHVGVAEAHLPRSPLEAYEQEEKSSEREEEQQGKHHTVPFERLLAAVKGYLSAEALKDSVPAPLSEEKHPCTAAYLANIAGISKRLDLIAGLGGSWEGKTQGR